MPDKSMKEVIWITCEKGERQLVEATVYGDLAVHETYHDTPLQRPLYTVTHVHTGIAVKQDLTYVVACQLRRELSTLDWSGGKVESIVKRNSKPAREVFKRVLGE
jgi:hypothetical protein